MSEGNNAPNDAKYLLLVAHPDLPGALVATAGVGISIDDTGLISNTSTDDDASDNDSDERSAGQTIQDAPGVFELTVNGPKFNRVMSAVNAQDIRLPAGDSMQYKKFTIYRDGANLVKVIDQTGNVLSTLGEDKDAVTFINDGPSWLVIG